jgi:nitrate/nitrite transporter NarK
LVASFLGGYLVDKIGAKRVLLLGFAITLTSGAVMGFGIGIIIGAPLNILILQSVDPRETERP